MPKCDRWQQSGDDLRRQDKRLEPYRGEVTGDQRAMFAAEWQHSFIDGCLSSEVSVLVEAVRILLAHKNFVKTHSDLSSALERLAQSLNLRSMIMSVSGVNG